MSKAVELAVIAASVNGAYSIYEGIVKSATFAARRGENEVKCQLNVSEDELRRVVYLLREGGFKVILHGRREIGGLTVSWGI